MKFKIIALIFSAVSAWISMGLIIFYHDTFGYQLFQSIAIFFFIIYFFIKEIKK